MPSGSTTIGEEQPPQSNDPVDIESLLAIQCPPGEVRPAPSDLPTETNGQIRALPTPPQDNPTPAPLMDHTRSTHTGGVETAQRYSALPPGVYFREPQQPTVPSEITPGPAENSHGVTESRRYMPVQHASEILDAGEQTSPSTTLDTLRLLEASRHRDQRSTGLPSYTRSYRPEPNTSTAYDLTHPSSLQNSRPSSRSFGEIAPQSVRWPVTSDITAPLHEPTSVQLYNNHHGSSSGPTSTQEDILRRAYRTLQDQSGSIQQLRTSAHNYARLASGRDWSSSHQRAASPYPSNDFTHSGEEPRMTAQEFAMRYPDPPTSHPPSSIRSRPHHVRQSSALITPDRSDLIKELPPLTPLTGSEGKDYGFRDASSKTSPPSSNNSDDKSLTLYRTLTSHRLSRYQPSCLHNGAVFEGTQCSDRQEYNVRVEIKHVDMDESFLCGHLIIEGLTQDHPKLETYFEGEIIGNKYTFTTRHADWGASEKQDMLHWNRFAAWKPLARAARSSDFSYKDFAEREHIFMRWKEYFLVPDHRVTAISGASFEGFYYICFNQRRGTFSGIYYHAKSERRWQQLELRHVAQRNRGCMPAVEMS